VVGFVADAAGGPVAGIAGLGSAAWLVNEARVVRGPAAAAVAAMKAAFADSVVAVAADFPAC
jgi:hypothetical protein